MNTSRKLILGSSSLYRQQQLRRLQLPFQVAKPCFDEAPLPHETAPQTALRLAEGKARSLACAFPDALIIGSDQVAWCHEQQLGKPLTVAKAQQMLRCLRGQTVSFYSAVVLLNVAENRIHKHVDETQVTMRALTDAQIAHYLALEPDAVHCAGAAKSEGLGALLIERIDSSDPHALIGLPIFRLVDFLLAEGMEIL
ncbi:nucleoside triphosphate pyrophosphatase [Snodgrassella sp. CFCC 13594]|uniref:Maf family protein n=1 Tax=Snodgrassella sp. CFCC 13594 TaxID=1775559 RepID=UPI00082DB9BD|nr:Maf family nucleotide pyrophosphatase [Snodgrassella sp. CFCC 13594]